MSMMKKIISMVTAFVLVLALACSVCASTFIPSISFNPTISVGSTTVVLMNGGYFGMITLGNGSTTYISPNCLIITPLSKVLESEYGVHATIRKNLLDCYNGINDGTVEVPAGESVRDIIDVSWTCDYHEDMLNQPGVTMTISFKLGVAADEDVAVYTYDVEDKVLEPVVKAVNNGDGTVSVEFEHLCPVVFTVSSGDVVVEQPVEACVEEVE